MTLNTEILIQDKSSNGILRLVMNDLATRNSLSENMMNSLIDSIDIASKDKDTKVIVIASTGNVFCSGHDLKEINTARNNDDQGNAYYDNLFKKCSLLCKQLLIVQNQLLLKLMGQQPLQDAS